MYFHTQACMHALFELHRTSKARFEYAIRYIKRNEASLRKESLANKMADGDSKGLWKLIRGGSNVRVPLPTSVEGVTGEPNIADLWRTHYKDIFNTADDGCRAANCAVCNDVYNDIQVSYNELSSTIDYLDINKSCGLDGIYAEHLKFGSYSLADLLSQCLSRFFTHGSLPNCFKKYLSLWLNQKLDVSCPRTTIDQLRLPVWSANLLKSLSIMILILVQTSLDLTLEEANGKNIKRT